MSRYIDADAFLEDESEAYIRAQSKIDDEVTWLVNSAVHQKVQMLIHDAPTADVVEVIRCKDCKQFEPLKMINGKTDRNGHCKFFGFVDNYAYCYYANRKDGAE